MKKNAGWWVMLGCAVALGTGCRNTALKVRTLDQDIPTSLVWDYASSNKPYVDEGETLILPLVIRATEDVAKTSAGFQAKESGSFLFGLLYWSAATAEFNREGRLQEYHKKRAVLTGLLLQRQRELRRVNGTMQEGGGWSLAWGAVGFQERASGERTATLAWIPIPVGRATRP